MEILFLTTVLPHGRTSGGEIASQVVIDALRAQGHTVTVVGFRRRGEPAGVPEHSVEAGVRPIETASAGMPSRGRWALVAAARSLPFSAAKYRSRGYMRTLGRLVESGRFELAVVDHGQLAWLVPRLSGLRTVAQMHNVEHRVYARRRAGSRLAARVLAREARLIRRLEDRLARDAAAVWTYSREDARYWRDAGARQVHTLSLPSAFAPAEHPDRKRCDVALIGSWTWELAREALEWFVSEVEPLVEPDLSVEVAGRGADWLPERAPRVRYRGFVRDALEFMASARVVAVPAFGTTGVQIKTLDAIASGAQVVANSDAVRDLGELPESVHVVDAPSDFAAALNRAARSTASAGASADALAWSRRRREHFDSELGAALAAAAA